MKANYHTHTLLCNHAEGNVEDYVKKAIELKMEEIGISDHNPIPMNFMSQEDYNSNWAERNMQLDQYYNIYLVELEDVIKRYGDKIKILKGLECEYIPSQHDYYANLKKDLDYLNLGMHFFIDSNNCVINSYTSIDYKNVLEYAYACKKAMQSKLFKILVHPDLFMFWYKNETNERIFDENCEKASRIIIESAIENDVYLEINANGLSNSRKYAKQNEWLYPDYNFWKIVKEYELAKIIIGSDAHRPDDLMNDDVDAVIEFAKKLQLNIKEQIKL